VILRRAAEALDFGQPTAVMPLGVHLIQDSEDPRGIVARLMERGPEPGVHAGSLCDLLLTSILAGQEPA
jgi:hypothetical protein